MADHPDTPNTSQATPEDDPRLKKNVFKTPVEREATPPPETDEHHSVARLIDARFGLILPTERVFMWGILNALSQKYIRAVEIGSWTGFTMQMLRRAVDELYCIDPIKQWIPSDDIVTRSGKAVQLVLGRSPDALAQCPAPFTFVFVDGDHSENGVYNDTVALENLMEPGGVICYHDANHPPVKKGLKRGVAEWKRDHKFYELACDTIARTPEGIYAGLALILVEPTSTPSMEPACFEEHLQAARKNPEENRLEPFSFTQIDDV